MPNATPDNGPEGSHMAGALRIALIAGVYFAVFRYGVTLAFFSSDDVAMMMLSNGSYSGTPSSFLVFINAYLGAALAALYTLTDQIAWYPGLFLLTLSLCAALLTERIWARRQKLNLVEVSLFVVAMLFVVVFTVKLQFTTVAGAALTLGIWTVLTTRDRAAMGVGSTLIVLGFLLRFEAAALALLVMLPFALLHVLHRGWSGWRHGSLMILLCFCALLHVAGQQKSRTMAPDFVAFNDLRGQINDNPGAKMPTAEIPANLSRNDFDLLAIHFFADTKTVSLEDLQAVHLVMENRARALSASDYIDLISDVLEGEHVYLFMFVAGLLVLFAPTWPLFSVRFISVFGLLAIFVNIEATAALKDRAIQVGLFALMVSFYFQPKIKVGAIRTILVSAIVGIASLYMANKAWLLQADTEDHIVNFETQRSFLETWPGKILVFGDDLEFKDAPLFSNALDRIGEKVRFKGWMVGHPDNIEFSANTRLLEPDLALLVQAQNANAVDRLITTFFAENHDLTVLAEVVAENGEDVLLKFARAPQ